MKHKKQNLLRAMGLLVLFILFTFYGCKKGNDDTLLEIPEGKVQVKVNVENANFDEGEEIAPRTFSNTEKPTSQQIKVNNSINMVVELTPLANTTASMVRSGPSPLDPGTKYRLLVFKTERKGGKFVDSRDYTYTQEDNTEPLILDGDSYQFIAISLNSTTDQPEYTFTSPDSTLASCQIRNIAAGTDILRQKQERTVSREGSTSGTNQLSIQFRHISAQVTVVLDSSPLNKEVTLVDNAHLLRTIPTITLNLNNGSYSGIFDGNQSPISFSQTLPSNKATSTPILIFPTVFNNIDFRIPKLAIGQEPPFTNLIVPGLFFSPGTRYQLSIRFTPNDTVGTYNGVPVARIGGRIWMRHNLGASYSLNADLQRTDDLLWGNYYQWGYITSTGRGNDIYAFDYSRTSVRTDNSTWNLTPNSDIPTANTKIYDPCPQNFRVPTRAEYEALVANTDKSEVGNWASGNLSSSLKLTSQTNPEVMLTFPAAGARQPNNPDGIPYVVQANTLVSYLTSTATATTAFGNTVFAFNYVRFGTPGYASVQKNQPRPLRCVAASSDKININ